MATEISETFTVEIYEGESPVNTVTFPTAEEAHIFASMVHNETGRSTRVYSEEER